MPINGFVVGRDLALSVITGAGALSLDLITGFRSKQDTQQQKIKGIDGVTRHVRFFDGWSGGFNIESQDRTVDDYFNRLEANYYQGIGEGEVTITETVTQADGSVAQYRYREVLLSLDDAGEFRGDASVKQSILFVASRRVTIA